MLTHTQIPAVIFYFPKSDAEPVFTWYEMTAFRGQVGKCIFLCLAGNLLVRNLGISAIFSAIVLRFFYIQHQWKQNVRAEAQAAALADDF